MTETIILLHGLARTSASLLILENRLEEEGFITINETYPSTDLPLPELIETVIPPLLQKCEQSSKIHFVTHSMGGIVVRGYLANNTVPNLGRIVMLAPPNRGSKLVNRMRDVPGFDLLNGPAGDQLSADMNSVPNTIQDKDAEIGVIAGDLSLNPIFDALIDEPNDGKVTVEETKLKTMKDHLVLPVSHTFIMNSGDVARQIVHFLKYGYFAPSLDD